MDSDVLVTIRSQQAYDGQEPETIELTTEGSLLAEKGMLRLSYEGSELTGMTGTKTDFDIYPNRVVLRRTGHINSVMEFEVGIRNTSRYTIDEGSLLLTVRAQKIENNMDEHGGSLRMVYQILIEGASVGNITYEITAVKR